jgi:hypothetical protein
VFNPFQWLFDLFRGPIVAATKINEKTRLTLEVAFINEDNTLVQPATARWRAYCKTTGTDITDWADLSVPASGKAEIPITASITSIIDDRNATEEKIIAAEGDYGTDSQISADHMLIVKNLQKTS